MATRNAMTVIREIAAVKAAVSDVGIREALLGPLESELQFFAEAAKRQGKLALPVEAVTPSKTPSSK